ncbi:MAG: hypothetical protein WCJ67_12345 [Thermoleophilia bacterium]
MSIAEAGHTDAGARGGVRCTPRWLIAVLPLLLLVALILMRSYEVMSKSLAPGSDSTFIYQLRFFDAITLKAQPDVQPSLDVINAYVLVVVSTLALFSSVLLYLNGGARRPLRFFLLVGIGTLWLAADELMGGHETIAANLPFLADLPGIDHGDDAIMVIYAVVAIAIVFYFRDLLREATYALRLFAAAVLTTVVGSSLDVIRGQWLEEPVEVIASMLVLFGFAALMLHHLVRAGVVKRPQDA